MCLALTTCCMYCLWCPPSLQSPVQFEYVELHYTDAAGDEAVFRASPEHGIMLPAAAINPANPQAVPSPGNVKAMSKVVVGDLVAVRTSDGKWYTAPVTSITR